MWKQLISDVVMSACCWVFHVAISFLSPASILPRSSSWETSRLGKPVWSAGKEQRDWVDVCCYEILWRPFSFALRLFLLISSCCFVLLISHGHTEVLGNSQQAPSGAFSHFLKAQNAKLKLSWSSLTHGNTVSVQLKLRFSLERAQFIVMGLTDW